MWGRLQSNGNNLSSANHIPDFLFIRLQREKKQRRLTTSLLCFSSDPAAALCGEDRPLPLLPDRKHQRLIAALNRDRKCIRILDCRA